MFDGSTTYEFLEILSGPSQSPSPQIQLLKANSSAAMNMNEKSALMP